MLNGIRQGHSSLHHQSDAGNQEKSVEEKKATNTIKSV